MINFITTNAEKFAKMRHPDDDDDDDNAMGRTFVIGVRVPLRSLLSAADDVSAAMKSNFAEWESKSRNFRLWGMGSLLIVGRRRLRWTMLHSGK